MTALLKAGERNDEEVYDALFYLAGRKAEDSPVFRLDPVRCRHLFAEVWRKAASKYKKDGRDLFSCCFGRRTLRIWFPLASALVFRSEKPSDRDYEFDCCRSYQCRGGVWQVRAYEKQYFDRDLLKSLLHGTDLKLRRYLGTGRYLREDPRDAWAEAFIDEVIREDRLAAKAAARPRIRIDLSSLDEIRRDALITRDSLLTEEEMLEAEEPAPLKEAEEAFALPDIPLDALSIQVLKELLSGGTAAGLLKEHHLMPSLEADAVNEALYGIIGDTVVLCENDRLFLVDDYKDELLELVGGALS